MNEAAVKESEIALTQSMLPAEDEALPAVDILDRGEMVEQIVDLLKTLSDARSSCSFALDGKWGVGKTFLLNMLEPRLREYQDGEKFIVFHYNCWQYDYYEEPLIAIVSAMLDNVEDTKLIPDKVKDKVRKSFAAAKVVLKKVAYSFIENKIGIDAEDITDLLEEMQEAAGKETGGQREYDKYYAFHKTIEAARTELSALAKEQTLVIVVDELDRCLPDYTIKILERLHHLFAGLNNTVLIMAIDKGQLEHTVKKTFGEQTDCGAYLKKFIDFEYKIDTGTVNDSFFEKYRDYVDLFDENALEPWRGINAYIAALFSGIEIRRQEHLVKKIYTIHRLLFGIQEKKDYSFLCFELLMAVLSEIPTSNGFVPFYYYGHIGDFALNIDRNIPTPLEKFIGNWSQFLYICQEIDDQPYYGGDLNIPLLIIGYSELTYGKTGILKHRPDYDKHAKNIEHFKKIKQLLEIIR